MARPRRGRLLAVAAVAVCLVAGLAPVALGAISDALDPLTPAEREAKYAEPRTSPLAMPFGASIGKGLMSLFPAFPISIDDIENGGVSVDDPSQVMEEYGGYAIAVLVALFIGILNCNCACCTCCCFYCCRACGKCGGSHPVEEGYSDADIMKPAIGFGVVSLLLIFCVLIGFLNDPSLETSFVYLQEDVLGTGAELLAKVDDALAVASGTLDSVAEDFGSIESIAGTNDTLSADIQAGLQGDIDAIGSNLTLLEAERQSAETHVGVLQGDFNATKAGQTNVTLELTTLEEQLANMSSVTINGTAYDTGFPLVPGIADGVPDMSGEEGLAGVQSQLRSLPNFTAIRVDMDAEWANISTEIDAELEAANSDLNQTIGDMMEQFSDATSFTDQMDEALSQMDDYVTYIDDGETYMNDAKSPRLAAFWTPAALTAIAILLGTVGLVLAHTQKRRYSPLFTSAAVLCFLAMMLFWLVYTIYFPLAFVFHEVCDILPVAVDYALNGTEEGREVFDECVRAEGNLFNTGLADFDSIEQELTSFNVADDIRDSLDLSNLFDFGTGDGPSLSDELAAAAAINGSSFDYGALAFNASDIGYDLSELTANMTARENSLAPADFGWDPSTCDTALASLNAETTMAGYFFTHANISLYNSSDHTGNPDVEPLYVRYVGTVDVNDTVTDTIADLRSESASARNRIGYLNNTLIPETVAMGDALNLNISALPAWLDPMQVRANYTAQAADGLVAAANAIVGAAVGELLDAVDAQITAAVDDLVSSVRDLGDCTFVGWHYEAIRTDLCEGFLGTLHTMWAMSMLSAILLIPMIAFLTCNGKRAGNTLTYVMPYADADAKGYSNYSSGESYSSSGRSSGSSSRRSWSGAKAAVSSAVSHVKNNVAPPRYEDVADPQGFIRSALPPGLVPNTDNISGMIKSSSASLLPSKSVPLGKVGSFIKRSPSRLSKTFNGFRRQGSLEAEEYSYSGSNM